MKTCTKVVQYTFSVYFFTISDPAMCESTTTSVTNKKQPRNNQRHQSINQGSEVPERFHESSAGAPPPQSREMREMRTGGFESGGVSSASSWMCVESHGSTEVRLTRRLLRLGRCDMASNEGGGLAVTGGGRVVFTEPRAPVTEPRPSTDPLPCPPAWPTDALRWMTASPSTPRRK